MIISTWKILLWLHVLYSRLCLGPVCHYHPLHASLLTVRVISCSSVLVCRGQQTVVFFPARPASEGLPRLKRLLLHQPRMLFSYEGTTPWAFNRPDKSAHCSKSNCPPRNNTYSFVLMCKILRKQCDLQVCIRSSSRLRSQCLPLNTKTKSNRALTFCK